MKLKSVISIALSLVMGLTCLTGCAANGESASGGVLRLSVNPEIAVYFDKDGKVTQVEARNDDGNAITADYTGYEGAAAQQVVVDLVTAIGEAGYFVEEVDGECRQIVLEIEPGSKLPSETFLAELANAVHDCVNSHHWTAPVEVKDCRDDDERDDGICTNPNCDDDDCDDTDCDDNDLQDDDDRDDGICTNPNCDDDDCDDADCDDNERDDGICTNPNCDDDDCDDTDCDDNDLQDDDNRDDGICTNPNCDDDDCDDNDRDDDHDDHHSNKHHG